MSRLLLIIGTGMISAATALSVALIHQTPPQPDKEPFEQLHFSAPEVIDPAVLDDEILDAPFVRYQSDSFGYQLRYPGTWQLDDSRQEFAGDVLSDPAQNVVITISETKDAGVATPQGKAYITQSVEESLQDDPAFALQRFQPLTWKKRYTLYTDGLAKVDGETWRTREYHVFRPTHQGILNISITTRAEAIPLYEEALQGILHSLSVCPSEAPQILEL